MKNLIAYLLTMVVIYGLTYLFFSYWNWNFDIREWTGFTRGTSLLTAFFWTSASTKAFVK